MSNEISYNGRSYYCYPGTSELILRCPDCGGGQRGIRFAEYSKEPNRWKFACSHCQQCLFPVTTETQDIWRSCGSLFEQARFLVPLLRRYTSTPILSGDSTWHALYLVLRVTEPDLHSVSWDTALEVDSTEGRGLVRKQSRQQSSDAAGVVRKRLRKAKLDSTAPDNGAYPSLVHSKLIHGAIVTMCTSAVMMEIEQRRELDEDDGQIEELLQQVTQKTSYAGTLPFEQHLVDFVVACVFEQWSQLLTFASEQVEE